MQMDHPVLPLRLLDEYEHVGDRQAAQHYGHDVGAVVAELLVHRGAQRGPDDVGEHLTAVVNAEPSEVVYLYSLSNMVHLYLVERLHESTNPLSLARGSRNLATSTPSCLKALSSAVVTSAP